MVKKQRFQLNKIYISDVSIKKLATGPSAYNTKPSISHTVTEPSVTMPFIYAISQWNQWLKLGKGKAVHFFARDSMIVLFFVLIILPQLRSRRWSAEGWIRKSLRSDMECLGVLPRIQTLWTVSLS